MEDNTAGVKVGYDPGSVRAGKQEAGASRKQMVALACRFQCLCLELPTRLSLSDRTTLKESGKSCPLRKTYYIL